MKNRIIAIAILFLVLSGNSPAQKSYIVWVTNKSEQPLCVVVRAVGKSIHDSKKIIKDKNTEEFSFTDPTLTYLSWGNVFLHKVVKGKCEPGPHFARCSLIARAIHGMQITIKPDFQCEFHPVRSDTGTMVK